MRFTDLKFAWWMLRGQSSRIWLLVFCLALGVTARVAVGSFSARLEKTLAREARKILTADIEISKRAPLTKKEKSELESLLVPGSRIGDVVHFVTMASAPNTRLTRLVELKAVEPSYPFYGQIQLSEPIFRPDENDPLKILNGDEPVAYVQPELLIQLGIQSGDFVRLGKTDFRIAGALAEEPGLGGTIFSLGPRILIGIRHVEKTGLVDLRSRAFHSTLIALPDPANAQPLAQKLKKIWNIPDGGRAFPGALGPESGIHVRTFRDKQFQTARYFERISDYMNLVTLVIVLMTGIGSASILRGFIQTNSESVAILCVLGASGRRLVWLFLAKVFGIGLVGSLLGALCGSFAQNIFPVVFSKFIALELSFEFDGPSVTRGIALGLFTSLYFSLLSILPLLQQKPLDIFRGEPADPLRGKTARWVALLGILAFGSIAMIESRSIVLGPYFIGTILVGGSLIYFCARLLLPRIARLSSNVPGFGIKHGLSNLNRAGLRPYSAAVVLGLSTLLLGILAVYQYSLLKELEPSRKTGERPALFLIDIQDDQIQQVHDFLSSNGVPKYFFSPMIKARYRSLNGRTVYSESTVSREGEEEQRMRHREQNLSYRSELSPDETILQGRWMRRNSDDADAPVEASLEEWFAERLGAKVGDRLAFDVMGVPLEAQVTSIRKVRWSSFQPNFFILLTPQSLQDAPKTWVGTISGLKENARETIQSELVRGFPNLTVFDIERAGQKVVALLDRISWSVQLLAIFSLLAGILVLIGIAQHTARQRREEALLLRILGANRKTIFCSIAAEFSALGFVAGMPGILLAALFGWNLTQFVIEIPFVLPWTQLFLILLTLVLLSAITGVLACRGTVSAKPLSALRADSGL